MKSTRWFKTGEPIPYCAQYLTTKFVNVDAPSNPLAYDAPFESWHLYEVSLLDPELKRLEEKKLMRESSEWEHG